MYRRSLKKMHFNRYLIAWSKLNKTHATVYYSNGIIWNNSNIKVGNRTLSYKNWNRTGLKYIIHYKEEYTFLKPEFYGDLVYRFRKIVGKSNFSEQFRKLINRYKRIGYSLDIMRQTACLVVNPIILDGYASLFNCTTAVWASDSMTASS